MSKYFTVDVSIAATVCVEAEDEDDAVEQAESFVEEECKKTQMDAYWVEANCDRIEEVDEDEYNEFNGL